MANNLSKVSDAELVSTMRAAKAAKAEMKRRRALRGQDKQSSVWVDGAGAPPNSDGIAAHVDGDNLSITAVVWEGMSMTRATVLIGIGSAEHDLLMRWLEHKAGVNG